ncbi:hypothetical protein JHK85_021616 [Glycine max]|nr:hypothetical protein JHK85_021616 [Glycine max]
MSRMAMRVSPSASSALSLLNCKQPPPVSCIRVPCLSRSSPPSLSYTFNPLRSFIGHGGSRSPGFRVHCYAPAPLTPPNLQWISTISSVVLILARGTAVPKSYIVPLFALQAPAGVVSWIKGRYGVWTAFLALLIRLFFYIPGELELPFLALLLLMVAPYEAMKLREANRPHVNNISRELNANVAVLGLPVGSEPKTVDPPPGFSMSGGVGVITGVGGLGGLTNVGVGGG